MTTRGKTGAMAGAILKSLKDLKAGLTVAQIAGKVGVVSQTVTYHLKRLAEDGRVYKTDKGKWVRLIQKKPPAVLDE